jgi:arsenate reductase-like glutaredoxin family protein
MPVVSVSLSKIGYEGYLTLPKGGRSRKIDQLLREYALEHHKVHSFEESISVAEVLRRQEFMKQSLETLYDQNKQLKKELKEE